MEHSQKVAASYQDEVSDTTTKDSCFSFTYLAETPLSPKALNLLAKGPQHPSAVSLKNKDLPLLQIKPTP
ncbi:hypothetical protein GBA52_015271 [Prunus armeniaca]|nr:hypothetical protein GBA52_015271 [Prunus armeniaca]